VGVGLGNSSAYPLVQGGSGSDYNHNTGPVPPYAWIEAFPQTPILKASVFGNVGGHLLYVHIHFGASGIGTRYWHIVDQSSGIDRTFSLTYGGTRPDGHAEFIGERPTVNGKLPALADFRHVNFENANSSTGSGWKCVGNLSHYWFWMQDLSGFTNDILAKPGPIDSTGCKFSVNWVNFS